MDPTELKAELLRLLLDDEEFVAAVLEAMFPGRAPAEFRLLPERTSDELRTGDRRRHMAHPLDASVAIFAHGATPVPTETQDKRCPHCVSVSVTRTGGVTIDGTGIRNEYRCQDCLTLFVVVSWGSPPTT